MELTDTQLTWFVDNRLRLPAGSREKYIDQVENLIKQFSAAAEADPVIDVVGFRKTGSLVKGTVLRPRDGVPVDSDLAVFLRADASAPYDLASLHRRLRRLLIKAFPTKRAEDFTVQPRTLGIVFRGSGLEVDLVPVIPIDGPGEFGLQPSSEGKAPLKTSIARQLEFANRRKEADQRFTRLVRMLKYWRNFQELDAFRSFLIELVVSHIQDREGPAPSLEKGLLRFFLFIAQNQFRQPIVFPENGSPIVPQGRAVVLDPVNSQNNVASRLTDADCAEIVRKAGAAWETLTGARNKGFKGETLELWKNVFGRSFAVEE